MVVVVQAAFRPKVANRNPVVDFFGPGLSLIRGLWELQLLDQLRAPDRPHHGAEVGQLKGLKGVLGPPLQERGGKVGQTPVLLLSAGQAPEEPAHLCRTFLGLLQHFGRNLVWIGLRPRCALGNQQLGPTCQVRSEGFRLQNSGLQLVSLEDA